MKIVKESKQICPSPIVHGLLFRLIIGGLSIIGFYQLVAWMGFVS